MFYALNNSKGSVKSIELWSEDPSVSDQDTEPHMTPSGNMLAPVEHPSVCECVCVGE